MNKTKIECFGWIIVGAQTRPEYQPDSEWVDNIVSQAWDNHIPIFLKNNLKQHHTKSAMSIFFRDAGSQTVHQFPESWKKEVELL